MTDYSALLQPDKGQPAHDIHLVDPTGYDDWLKAQPERHRAAALAQGLQGKADFTAILPGDKPEQWSAVCVVAKRELLNSWSLAALAERLPAGTYRLADEVAPGPAKFGWVSAQYRFDRYLKPDAALKGQRILLTPNPKTIATTLAEFRAVAMVRDMVNTPSADMGPEHLEKQAAALAKQYGGELKITKGDPLKSEFPMVHAVGRAASREHAPRMIEIHWGNPKHARLALIGKGVAFDSGGLDIKPAAAMRLMKKDMGGAAHALALAGLVMEAGLPVRLHLLVPAVENAISADAFRPGEVLMSRAGVSVEIHNTDAEGRLILADALTRAGEEKPELIVDFATLTGAARVALGPDLPALFSPNDALASAIHTHGLSVDDPSWRLPLWTAYAEYLKSDIADIANASDSPFAGTITAALFLGRFVPAESEWAHFDTFAWRATTRPGRPKGGDALGLRAMWSLLKERYGAST